MTSFQTITLTWHCDISDRDEQKKIWLYIPIIMILRIFETVFMSPLNEMISQSGHWSKYLSSFTKVVWIEDQPGIQDFFFQGGSSFVLFNIYFRILFHFESDFSLFFRILFYQSLHFHVLLNFHLFIHFPLFHLTAPSYMTRDSYTGYNILRYCSTSSWDHIKSMYNLFRDLVVPIQGQIKAYWGPKLWEVVQTLYGSS